MDGFVLIADPTRRRILDRLRLEPCDVGGLIELLGLSQPLVSKHLRVLRDAGAVTVTIDGRRRLYQLAVDPLPEVLAWVTPYYRSWTTGFDRLARILDEDAAAVIDENGNTHGKGNTHMADPADDERRQRD